MTTKQQRVLHALRESHPASGKRRAAVTNVVRRLPTRLNVAGTTSVWEPAPALQCERGQAAGTCACRLGHGREDTASVLFAEAIEVIHHHARRRRVHSGVAAIISTQITHRTEEGSGLAVEGEVDQRIVVEVHDAI